jgi:hypothetical protein
MLEGTDDEVKWKKIFNPPNKKEFTGNLGEISKLCHI